jgi:hypothetical protein
MTALKNKLIAFAGVLALSALCHPAEARPRPHSNDIFAGIRSITITMHRVHRHGSRSRSRDQSAIVPHPSGCPARAFCGCGASVHLFGHPVRELYLAANWFRFPRAEAAPGMAAVRRHHVFVLEQHISGNVWLAFDANSGGHATRLHPRSIAGYVIVNPHSGGERASSWVSMG